MLCSVTVGCSWPDTNTITRTEIWVTETGACCVGEGYQIVPCLAVPFYFLIRNTGSAERSSKKKHFGSFLLTFKHRMSLSIQCRLRPWDICSTSVQGMAKNSVNHHWLRRGAAQNLPCCWSTTGSSWTILLYILCPAASAFETGSVKPALKPSLPARGLTSLRGEAELVSETLL